MRSCLVAIRPTTPAARFARAPRLHRGASSLQQHVEPQVDIGLWLLRVLTHHPHPDEIVWPARLRRPLIDDPPGVLRVLRDGEPAEGTASYSAKAYADARTFAREPCDSDPDLSSSARGLDAPEICHRVIGEFDAVGHASALLRARSRWAPCFLQALSPRHACRTLWATRASQAIAVLVRFEPLEYIAKLPRPWGAST